MADKERLCCKYLLQKFEVDLMRIKSPVYAKRLVSTLRDEMLSVGGDKAFATNLQSARGVLKRVRPEWSDVMLALQLSDEKQLSCSELLQGFEKTLSKAKSVINAKRAAEKMRGCMHEVATDNSVAAYMTKARALVKKLHPEWANELDSALRLSQEKYVARKFLYKKTIVKRHKAGQVVINADVLLNIAASEMNHVGYIRRMLALILLTGRRPIELLSVGELSVSKKVNHLGFIGQAKVKERTVGKTDIPVLLSPDVVLEAWQKLRFDKVDLLNLNQAALNNKIGKQCTEAVRRVWSSNGIGHAYELRAAYASIAVAKFLPGDYSPQGYMSEILGHFEDDIQTVNSYQRFKLV